MTNWIDALKNLPVAFAQVREDSELDLQLCQHLQERFQTDISLLMIASGGDLVAHLLSAAPLKTLYITDMNPAQLLLTQLKVFLLETASPEERLKVLGHAPWSPEKRNAFLKDFFKKKSAPEESLGPLTLVAEKGPDYCGRYEGVFDQMQALLCQDLSCKKEDLYEKLLSSKTHPLLKKALDIAFEENGLKTLFSPQALQNKKRPFSEHFYHQTIKALDESKASKTENPFLHQFLSNSFGDGPVYPWLSAAPSNKKIPITYSHASMMESLKHVEDHSLHMIHLSNILDWLSEKEAASLLALCAQKLTTGGAVLIRQLNSTLKINQLSPLFHWDEPLATTFLKKDKSFFYRHLYVGFKT